MEDNTQKQLNNDNRNNTGISNNNLPVWEESLFGASPKDIYIHHKIEKICSAIHFVTNFFNDNEPLRLALRDRAVSLLSSSLSFVQSPNVGTLISSASCKLIEIKSFLLTSKHTGLISEMNFNIINKEIEDLLITITSKRNTLFSLSSSFLEVKDRPENSQSIRQSNIRQSENKIKDTTIPTNLPKDLTAQEPIGMMSSLTIIDDSYKDTDRTKKIISLIKDKGDISIKDISAHIKGCSEKTLQRELLRLVSLGRIKKSGDRRWSRYSMNS